MIAIGDTSVSRKEDLYRFQIERYDVPKFDLLRVYKNHGRKGIERRRKTISEENGYSWLVSTVTGEVLRKRRAIEIKHCVDASLSRTRRVMREILMSNKWVYFVTLTFNQEEQDRLDDKAVMRQFKRFRDLVRKKYSNMYYMAVPERHKKGGIHFHLLIGGVTAEELKLVDSGHKDKKGRVIYNCNVWKYGFSTVTEVEDTEKASSYILKYIGKELGISEVCKKRYWASRNCVRPKKKFFDIVSDSVVKVMDIFDGAFERTVSMTVKFWSKAKNYLVMKDSAPVLRQLRMLSESDRLFNIREGLRSIQEFT